MSRKDYITIANALHITLMDAIRAQNSGKPPGWQSVFDTTCHDITNILANDNSRFDLKRFHAAVYSPRVKKS